MRYLTRCRRLSPVIRLIVYSLEGVFLLPFHQRNGGSENDEKIESCDEENCRIMYRKRMMMMVRESVAAETILNWVIIFVQCLVCVSWDKSSLMKSSLVPSANRWQQSSSSSEYHTLFHMLSEDFWWSRILEARELAFSIHCCLQTTSCWNSISIVVFPQASAFSNAVRVSHTIFAYTPLHIAYIFVIPVSNPKNVIFLLSFTFTITYWSTED